MFMIHILCGWRNSSIVMTAALMKAITREIDAVTVNTFIVPRAGDWRLSRVYLVIVTISHIFLKPPVQNLRATQKTLYSSVFPPRDPVHNDWPLRNLKELIGAADQ